jgi:hypothetical protein
MSDPQPSAEAQAQEIPRRFDGDLGAISRTSDNMRDALPIMTATIADALREREREALEKAAKLIERWPSGMHWRRDVAAAIRALGDRSVDRAEAESKV